MRILILNQVAAPVSGEMNRYVLDLAGRLRAAGDAVALVHGRNPKSEFAGTGYIFDYLQDGARDDREVNVRLEAIVEDFAPDVIQIHGVSNLKLDAMLALKAPTVRFIHNHLFYCSGQNMTWHVPHKPCGVQHDKQCLASHYLHGCGSMNPVTNLMRYRRVSDALEAIKKLQGVQVASNMIKENLVRNGLQASRIEHLPLYSSEPFEKKIYPATGRRMILHTGGLVPNKGVWLMARSVAELPSDVNLTFAGGGALQGEVEAYVKRHGLGQRIRIIEGVTPEQLSHLYHQSTLVVMPSMWNEPLGLSGLHAMAHGKPVVAFQSGGIGEWLEDGRSGIAVPFANRRAFVQSMKRLLGQPAELAAMGEAGRRIWEEKFRASGHIRRLREYYARIAASRRG